MAERTYCDICGRIIPSGHPNGRMKLDWNGLTVAVFRAPHGEIEDLCSECIRKAAQHGRIIIEEAELNGEERLRSTDSG